MLDKKPDLVVANGDHIYWDYRFWEANRDGAANEDVLTSVGDEQITRCIVFSCHNSS